MTDGGPIVDVFSTSGIHRVQTYSAQIATKAAKMMVGLSPFVAADDWAFVSGRAVYTDGRMTVGFRSGLLEPSREDF